MQAVIGEIFSSYRKTDNGLYTHSFTGTGMDFPDLFLITALSDDAAGRAMKEMLGSSGRRMEIIPSMLHSAFIAGDDVLLKLSAPSGIRTEDLVDVLSRHPEIDGAVLSAPLLSVNPSADAIADAVSFAPGIKRIAIYTGSEGYGGAIYERVVRMLGDAGRPVLVSDSRDEILAFISRVS